MTELPDYYPIANATWAEKLEWLKGEVPPYARILEAAPWYSREEQVDWCLESLREWLKHPAFAPFAKKNSDPAFNRIAKARTLQPPKGT